MVIGFTGDASGVPVFAVCMFLMTNDALYNMLVAFLRRTSSWFDE